MTIPLAQERRKQELATRGNKRDRCEQPLPEVRGIAIVNSPDNPRDSHDKTY